MKQEFSVAFLGGIYPDDISRCQKFAKVSLDYAADAYQKKYLSAFAQCGIEDIKIFSSPFYGSWPINSKLFYVSENGYSKYGCVEYINYINLIGIRRQSRKYGVIKAVKKWYSSVIKKTPLLLVYSAVFSEEIIQLKRQCKKLKIAVIVPDLPQFTYLSDKSFLRRVVLNRDVKTFEKSCSYVDLCVCITKQMKVYLERNTGAKCIVIEGIADKNRCEESIKRISDSTFGEPLNIVYTGTLEKKYGVLDLVKSFTATKQFDCRLIICGGGNTESEIRNFAEKDKRICFYGVVSNEKSKELQNSAAVLINPRQASEEYTAYSFPSKTVEYLETGNIVICYKLPGIPDDYDGKLLYIENGDPVKKIADALRKALSLSEQERLQKGMDNLKFLIDNKCGSSVAEIFNNI